MVFSSYQFICIFLPSLFFCYHITSYFNVKLLKYILLAFSIAFYGYWSVDYLALIVLSCLINFFLAHLTLTKSLRKFLVPLGVIFNLVLLGYYKYFNFLIDTLHNLNIAEFEVTEVLLPLAISFFTFQQIGYLIDCSHGAKCERNFANYMLFVMFFPQLIAGPIVRHDILLPQLKCLGRLKLDNVGIGARYFITGLFCKVLLADNLSVQANALFDYSVFESSFAEAWVGVLSYTFQLYFDFFGYSLMAIGLGKALNISLPRNFNNPFLSENMSEFWQRWHITLSEFLQRYVFLPIAMKEMRFSALGIPVGATIITMTLSGFWHGAGWTFVLWGIYNGFLVVASQLSAKYQLTSSIIKSEFFKKICSRAVTFAVWTLGLVLFRSESWEVASGVYRALFQNQIMSEASPNLNLSLILLSCIFVWGPLRISYEIIERPKIHLPSTKQNTRVISESISGVAWGLTAILVILNIGNFSEFIYFQF